MEEQMASKIRIKLGPIEVEYEGPENFLKEELPQLLEAVANLHKQSGIKEAPPVGGAPAGSGAGTPQLQGTTTAIAAKLQCKTGPDLVMAAAARLTFALGKETFTRKELLDEMKTATAYYTTNYGKNLTPSINGLIKDGALNEPTSNTYSLSATKKTDLGKTLA